jgi:hypothetical protein
VRRRRLATVAVAAIVLSGCGSLAPTPESYVAAGGSAITTATPNASERANPNASPEPPGATTTTLPATPEPTATPLALAVPRPPSGATFKITYPSKTKNKMTVTWAGPRAKGVEIRVYGVMRCISIPSSTPEGSEGPCLVEHTPLPPSVRKLIGKAPASTGKLSWTWPNWENIGADVVVSPDGTSFASIVIAAYNDAGHSKFIIVAPGSWCGGCTY